MTLKPNADSFAWKEKAAAEQKLLKRLPRYYPFMVCALGSGMREGELIALKKPGEIGFKGGFIEDRPSAVCRGISTSKTGRTHREGIPAQLAEVLEDLHINIGRRKHLKWKTNKKGAADNR